MTKSNASVCCARLSYEPPFAWDPMLAFLSLRAIPGVEAVKDCAYQRTVCLEEYTGWVNIRNLANENALHVQMTESPEPSRSTILQRLRILFDLDADSTTIDAALSKDSRLRPSVAKQPGLRVPRAFDGFELAWRAVLGQQVSVRGASTLSGRFAARFGRCINSSDSGLSMLTPTPADVTSCKPADIARIGIPLARAVSLSELARLVSEQPDLLTPDIAAEDIFRRLTAIPGIGPWTAQYILMRAIRCDDVIPYSDLGLRKALGVNDSRQVKQITQAWHPWQAYAAMHLWSTLADNLDR